MRFFSKFFNSQFPKIIKEHWYCGAWYMYLSDLPGYKGNLDPDDVESPATDKVAFNHFHAGIYNEDKTGLIDGLIPAIRIGDKIGLYQVTRIKGAGVWYDGLPWDNGQKIDLKLNYALMLVNEVKVVSPLTLT